MIFDAIARERNGTGKGWGVQDAFYGVRRDTQHATIEWIRSIGSLTPGLVGSDRYRQLEAFADFIGRCVKGQPILHGSPEPSAAQRGMGGRDETEYRPTFEDTLDISPETEAEWSGFRAGYLGLSVKPPVNYSADERAAFLRGNAAGFAEFEAEEFDRWVNECERNDAAFGDPVDVVDGSERREFAGV